MWVGAGPHKPQVVMVVQVAAGGVGWGGKPHSHFVAVGPLGGVQRADADDDTDALAGRHKLQ